MSKLVNKDYIGVVKEIAGRFYFDEEEIYQSTELLSELKSMVDNPNRTVLDMHERFHLAYPPGKSPSFGFCLPSEYMSSHLKGTDYPSVIDVAEYFSNIRNWYYPRMPEAMAKNQIKNDEFDKYERYINVYNFSQTLNRVKKESSIKMYSSDDIGWTEFRYKLNDDIVITLKSNFGYGSASYFFVNIRYKEIDLLPYSHCVKYYHANIIDLVRYTRQYYPERSRWNHALNFVVDAANQASRDPEAFERQWIFNEVQEMLSGLKSIMERPKENIENSMEMTNNYGYSTIYNTDDKDKSRYKIYPSESTIAYKAEKITGALNLLERLKRLESLRSDIDNVIEEIKGLNRDILPEINNSITSIKGDIMPLQVEYDSLNMRLKKVTEIINRHKEYIKTEKISDAEYQERFPRYNVLIDHKRELDGKTSNLWAKINDREGFIKILNRCIKTINSADII